MTKDEIELQYFIDMFNETLDEHGILLDQVIIKTLAENTILHNVVKNEALGVCNKPSQTKPKSFNRGSFDAIERFLIKHRDAILLAPSYYWQEEHLKHAKALLVHLEEIKRRLNEVKP